ncbi:DUF6867 family protein [Microbaculum sp. FT89]|uniref:DUF6867 family protein n=1 Tax=Microbaculum sp. FT89 TaxID=3447298 RepID=UPI003F53C9D2
MGILWEGSFGVFLLMTVFLGGGAAWLSGRAIALTWRPVAQIVLYMILLTAAVRFLYFSLFQETLLSLYYYLVNLAILLAIAVLGFRVTRARQMVTQYRWLYERAGFLGWKKRPGVTDAV